MDIFIDRTRHTIISLTRPNRRFRIDKQKNNYVNWDGFLYRHEVNWYPPIQNGLIIQKIERKIERRGQNVDITAYWELWEIFKRRVYPYNLVRFGRVFLPDNQPQAKSGGLVFEPNRTNGSYLRLTAAAQAPQEETDDNNYAEAVHDRFVLTNRIAQNAPGRWRIYAEVYILNEHEVAQHAANDLRRFAVGNVDSAGNLPSVDGHNDWMPRQKDGLPDPDIVRYEAGEFDFTFPDNSTEPISRRIDFWVDRGEQNPPRILYAEAQRRFGQSRWRRLRRTLTRNPAR